jgi:hypothetical protein
MGTKLLQGQKYKVNLTAFGSSNDMVLNITTPKLERKQL